MSQNIVSINSNSPQSQLHEMLSDLVDATLEALTQITDRDLRFDAHCKLCDALEIPSPVDALFAVQNVVNQYNLVLSTI